MPEPRESSFRPWPLAREPEAPGAPSPGASRKCVIESIGVYLPPRSESTREVLDNCRDTRWLSRDRAANVERLTGIRSRRVAGDDEASIELAKKAAAKCLALSTCGPSEIDLLISCSLSRYDGPNQYAFEPSAAARLRAYFGFENALAFDLTNGCAGMFTAIKIAAALIRARMIGVAMVVSGEHVTDLTRTAQKEISGRLLSDPRFACLTLGDSGAALILNEAAGDRAGFHAVDLYTAACHSGYSKAKPTDRPHGGLIMLTESVKLFDVAIRHSAVHAVQLFEKLRWVNYQPDHVIVHQSGHMAVYEAARQLNELVQREMCHDGNMVDNIGERGNTATTSHFVAIWDHILSGKLGSGDEVLFAIQGSGLTVGTAPYTFDDLPERVRHAEAHGVATSSPVSRRRPRTAPLTELPRIRIESVGVAPPGTRPGGGLDLAHAAVDQCLAGSSYRKDDMELLIYTGVHRDEFIGEPAIAAMLAGRVKVNDTGMSPSGAKTLAFDVFNGSIGFLNGCYIGAEMIRSRECGTVMVVASEIEANAGIPDATPIGVAGRGPPSSSIALPTPPSGSGRGRSGRSATISAHIARGSSTKMAGRGCTSTASPGSRRPISRAFGRRWRICWARRD